MEKLAQDHHVIGKRERDSPATVGLATVKGRAYATVRKAGKDRLEVTMVQSQSVEKEDEHIGIHLVVGVT
jgi:hypothetical protein